MKPRRAHFAERGWNVIATMRNPEDGAKPAADNVLVTRLDVLDDASIEAAVADGTERFGGIDALLNNAGYGAFRSRPSPERLVVKEYGPLEATPTNSFRWEFA